MTQEVQPLTWSKRTNIEEHQQFFSKINEIIGNLAPTVDEAEQAIAQATAAIASANDAVATANAASVAASAAASQAQTAASTVAGYDGRLTTAEGDIDAAEGDITALQGRMGTAEGNIAALQGVQGDYVKKAGAAQTVTSQIMVPTTATGLHDTQIANGTRIQNDLDAYAPMLRTTGNQVFSGVKRTNSPFEIYGYGTNNGLRLVTPIDRSDFTSSMFCDILNWCDKDANRIISLRVAQENDGSVKLTFLFHTPDGAQINIGYIGIDANGNAVKSGVFA